MKFDQTLERRVIDPIMLVEWRHHCYQATREHNLPSPQIRRRCYCSRSVLARNGGRRVASKEFCVANRNNGTDGLVIAGTTGESATLDRAEHAELITGAVDISAGRIPIIAGTGSNSTAQTIKLSVAIGDTGIDAYLLVVPYYNKPVQEGLFRHFSAIADAVDKPVMLYNVPGRTGADLLAETVGRLARHDNIFGIKEATGDVDRLKQIQELVDDDLTRQIAPCSGVAAYRPTPLPLHAHPMPPNGTSAPYAQVRHCR